MPPSSSDAWAAHVARYYDANTTRFRLVGPGGGTESIHRELWGPGVSSAAEAVDWVNGLLAGEIRRIAGEPASILDLGCGVGGTMFRLATAFPAAAITGVTVSPIQVRVGRELAERRGLAARCHFIEGDFGRLEADAGFDAAVAVESLAHAADPGDFFTGASRAVGPAGALVVVDDFLRDDVARMSAVQRRRIDDLRRGWRVPGLDTTERTAGAANAAGFDLVEDRDLTSLIRLGRPRDRVIRLVVPLLRAHRLAGVPFFGNMIGGDALQRGLADGSIRYRMLVFVKRQARAT